MNHISYDRWQAIIRLPYLVMLACWVGQRGRLYRGQTASLLAHLTRIRDRDYGGLLGQIADDSACELAGQLRGFSARDVSHFALLCERTLAAARQEMTDAQYDRFVRDAGDLERTVGEALPWHARLRAAFARAPARDLRLTLRRALASSLALPPGPDSPGATAARPA